MDHETRQLRRQREREEQKKQEQVRKQLNSYVTKAEYLRLVEAFNRLRDRVLHVDLFSAALEKVLLDRGVITRDEVDEAFKYETTRTVKFEEVNKMQGEYEKRLEICKEWNIDPSITSIPGQVFEDQTLTKDQKKDLADKYNIQLLKDLLKEEQEKDNKNDQSTDNQ